ncbi:C2 domain-containing protein [Leptospira idonii]|nr:C2 domain-containing protein [Leptospira idonii]
MKFQYLAGDSIKIPAPVGITNRLLGSTFDTNFKNQNDKAFEKGEIEIINEEQYISEINILDNEASLIANANFLGFINGNFSNLKDDRYALLSVYHISKTATYLPEGKPIDSADVFLKRIYYGWSIHYVISGNKSSFSSEAKMKLLSLSNILPTADISYTLGEFKLESRIKLVGLSNNQKVPTIISDPHEVNKYFQASQKEVPIFVEYETIKPLNTTRIDFESTKFKQGDYIIKYIKAEISNLKPSNNKSWDIFQELPDPFLQIFENGKIVFTSDKISNKLNPTFNIERKYSLKEGDLLQIGLYDHDMQNHDYIGDAWITYDELIQHEINKEIELNVRDGSGIKNIKIRLTPKDK